MSNGAINPPLVVIHALISRLCLEIYGFILCQRKSLIIDGAQNASLNISLFLSSWTWVNSSLFMKLLYFRVSLNYNITTSFRLTNEILRNIERSAKSGDTFGSCMAEIQFISTSNNKSLGSATHSLCTTLCYANVYTMIDRYRARVTRDYPASGDGPSS